MLEGGRLPDKLWWGPLVIGGWALIERRRRPLIVGDRGGLLGRWLPDFPLQAVALGLALLWPDIGWRCGCPASR